MRFSQHLRVGGGTGFKVGVNNISFFLIIHVQLLLMAGWG